MEGARQPTTAERVRTLVGFNASVSLTLQGARDQGPDWGAPVARSMTPDGDVLLLVPRDSPAARAAAPARGDEVRAVMEITDVAPVAVPHRVRGRAWVSGWLTAVRNVERPRYARLLDDQVPVEELMRADVWSLVRLEAAEVWVDDLWGTGPVDPDELAAAAPDPLAPYETELLQHLAAAHGGRLRALTALLGERAPRGCRCPGEGCRGRVGAVPVALDRFGLRVRFGSAAGGHFDARFDFPEPVSGVDELRRAMHRLFEAAER